MDINAAGVINCVKCGYDLRGNVSGVCPECGNRFSQPADPNYFARVAEADVKDG